MTRLSVRCCLLSALERHSGVGVRAVCKTLPCHVRAEVGDILLPLPDATVIAPGIAQLYQDQVNLEA
jgi:hypothetical protein